MALYLAAVGGSLTGASWVPQLSLPVVGVLVPGAHSRVKTAAPGTTAPAQPGTPGPTSPVTTSSGPGATGTQTTQNAIDQVQGPAPVPVPVSPAITGSASATGAPLPAPSTNAHRTSSPTSVALLPKTTPSGKTPPGQVTKITRSPQSNPGVTAPGRIKH
jgi:hypothetical protein